MAASATVTKRSLTVAGHRTSISLEDAFWDGLREIAARRGLTLAALVAAIDRARGAANLSSAIRVFVLANLHVAPNERLRPAPADGERPRSTAGQSA